MKIKIVGISICILLIDPVFISVSDRINKKRNTDDVIFNDNTIKKFASDEFIIKLKKILEVSENG